MLYYHRPYEGGNLLKMYDVVCMYYYILHCDMLFEMF